jgi:hypothetical protein
MVAVRMVSEGVDVPRLAVGVYATSASTPLFFAQAIGRFVRAAAAASRHRSSCRTCRCCLGLAGEMERERDHALDREGGDDDGLEDTLLAEAEREDKASDELEQEFSYQALGSVAHFDRVLFDGKEFGQLAVPGTPEEEEFLGLPGLLEPEHVHELLMQRQSRQSRHRRAREAKEGTVATQRRRTADGALPPALHRTLREQRQLLNSLVGLYARQSGEPHGRCMPSCAASAAAGGRASDGRAAAGADRGAALARALLSSPPRRTLARTRRRKDSFTSHWLLPSRWRSAGRSCEPP